MKTLINDYVADVIQRPIPDNRGTRYYTKIPEHLDKKMVNNRHHIIFISYYPDPQFLKKAMVMKATGRVYVTLIAGCIREDAKIENYFDQYYEYKSFRELHDIVSKSNPYSWHLAPPIYHGAIVINACSKKSNIVLDVNDAAFFMAKDKHDPSIHIERAVMNHVDHIVHKMPDAAWNNLIGEYGLQCGSTSIMSYPHPSFLHSNRLKAVKPTPHVAYAGGIIPYDIAVSRGHENHIFDDLIELTGPDTFELSIYVNQNARDMPWHQHGHYYDLEKSHHHFHFKQGLPYCEISRELSYYDAGIFFDNILLSSYSLDHFKYNLASKLFTYLEAGIPIVMYEESEFMADLVRDNNLGTIYSAREPRTIIKAIDEVMNNDYTQSIETFCREFSMEKYSQVLIAIHHII
ncbi:MAG: hypothetical protein KKD44_08560 [Proteobacteria bacterium]|nr:hypothetical protein [Pseudomonadota bacterium]